MSMTIIINTIINTIGTLINVHTDVQVLTSVILIPYCKFNKASIL